MDEAGWSWIDAGFFASLVALCATVAIVDWRHRIIPNACNAVLAALGLLLAATSGGAVSAAWAAAQGAAVFGLFWVIRLLYRALRAVQGLGLGDVKFLGAAGVWVGLEGIAPLLLVACASALAWIGIDWARGRVLSARHAIPFGPFLALGLVVVSGLSLRPW